MSATPTTDKLRALLGQDVVLLGWPLGKKATNKQWGHLTSKDMTPAYLKGLEGGNIGVALGRVSGGLVALDVDDDELVPLFLELNPCLKGTLQTHGARGRVFWLQMAGDYPERTVRLKTMAGGEVGEWRGGTNCQSIIHGKHPDGMDYQIVNKAKPLVVDFASIKWPEEIMKRPTLNTAYCTSASLRPCIPASLHTLHNKTDKILENVVARTAALNALTAEHPQLSKLYNKFIEPRFQAQPHGRNQFIVHSIPFLYRAVAPQFVMELIGVFYDCNRTLFNDSREQHLKEADAMLQAVAKTYAESLDAKERRIHDALPQHEQATFRICRDLASLKEPKRKANTFFLSFDHLADRLGIYPTQAQRIMRQLESYGLIKLLKKGTRRAAGVRGEAGTYLWRV